MAGRGEGRLGENGEKIAMIFTLGMELQCLSWTQTHKYLLLNNMISRPGRSCMGAYNTGMIHLHDYVTHRYLLRYGVAYM